MEAKRVERLGVRDGSDVRDINVEGVSSVFQHIPERVCHTIRFNRTRRKIERWTEPGEIKWAENKVLAQGDLLNWPGEVRVLGERVG